VKFWARITYHGPDIRTDIRTFAKCVRDQPGYAKFPFRLSGNTRDRLFPTACAILGGHAFSQGCTGNAQNPFHARHGDDYQDVLARIFCADAVFWCSARITVVLYSRSSQPSSPIRLNALIGAVL